MTTKHSVLFLTQRSPLHQQKALESAPPNLAITMLRNATREETLAHLADTEFLISERAGVIDADMLAHAPRLRLIQRLGSLAFDIDQDTARECGVAVCSMPVLGSILVAEHMVMQMLAITKRLPDASAVAAAAGDWRKSQRTDENTFAYNWSNRANVGGLYGLTVGILGFGEIGAELARRLQPFSLQGMLYHKRHPLPAPLEQEMGLRSATPDVLYAQSDILCNLLPYYPETDQMLNASVFQRMRPGSFVVSCGSGSVIDEDALAAAIRTGHLAGAALDTFEWEPVRADNPLVELARAPEANVLLTPHTAAGTPPFTQGNRARDYENIRRYLAGEPLLNRMV